MTCRWAASATCSSSPAPAAANYASVSTTSTTPAGTASAEWSRTWYLVGFDLDRDDWRTFRVDRLTATVTTGHRNTPRQAPDAAAQVAAGIAVHSFGTVAIVRLDVGVHHARALISPTAGVIDVAASDDQRTVVHIGGDPDWIAHYLARVDVDYEVLEPPEVRAALRALGDELRRRHRD